MKRFRVVNGFMAAVFLFAAIVQYNDPDPLLWVLFYASASAICFAVALRGFVPAVAAVGLTIVALGWAAALAAGVPVAEYTHMFDAWEMRSEPIEVARETSGLLIAAVWMAMLGAVGWRRRN